MRYAVVVRKGTEELVWSLHLTNEAADRAKEKVVKDLLKQGRKGHWYNAKVSVEQYMMPR